jgi:hypothetical protein
MGIGSEEGSAALEAPATGVKIPTRPAVSRIIPGRIVMGKSKFKFRTTGRLSGQRRLAACDRSEQSFHFAKLHAYLNGE